MEPMKNEPHRIPGHSLLVLRPIATLVFMASLFIPQGGCDRAGGGRSKSGHKTDESAMGLRRAGGQGLVADREGAARAGARLAPEGDSGAPPLKVLGGAILTIGEKYVAPTLVDPEKMFDKALEFVVAERPEILIRTEEGRRRKVIAQVGDRQKIFEKASLDSLSILYTELKQVLGFVREALEAEGKALPKEIAELEYAAVNGMASTLDPHSVLMPPKIYDEMRIRTQGAFGGIGIVISIRDGALTVISPIDGTPAAKAGVRAGDRIVKIEDESTVNMPLTDAVEMLRGKPGTPVVFWVEREGWPEARSFRVIREQIEIKSVDSKMLPGKIGYLRVNRFSHNTTEELQEHLAKLDKGDARGIVLDLWNNPGGLLQQAEKVADLFLSEGEIVITEAARGEVLRVRKASADTTRWRRPVVVLVNRGSASAAEIVAGALKQQGRAVVLGERTFGKGTVQMLFENDDSSALKLTVAQYLTPGNQSIQGVGVVPDVETNAVVLHKEWTRMFGHEADERRREKRKDLLPARSQKPLRPFRRVDYLSPESMEGSDSHGSAENAADGPVIELARQLLARHGGARDEMLRASKRDLEEWEAAQARQVAARLRARGVDWSPAPAGVTPAPLGTLEVNPSMSPSTPVLAGEELRLRLQVTNRGQAPIFRLRGRTEASSYFLDEREILVGRVGPGEARSVELKVRIPSHTRSSVQPIRVVLTSPSLDRSFEYNLRLGVRGLMRPRFQLSYRLHDDVKGNGDGRPEKGETVRLQVEVRNVGEGPMTDGVIALRNLSGHGLFVLSGRQAVKTLASGAKLQRDLTFRIEPDFKEKILKLEISAYDGKVQEGLSEHLKIPLDPPTATAPGLVGEISPPEIRIDPPPLEVQPGTKTVEIKGEASDPLAVRDLFIEVSNHDAGEIRHKAYYTAAPKGEAYRRLPFSAKVPLWPGLNNILVVAREKGEVMGFQRLVVLRPRLEK
jgi:carboxyl-terminal processing protease